MGPSCQWYGSAISNPFFVETLKSGTSRPVAPSLPVVIGENRQEWKVDAEQLEPSAVEEDFLARRIVDDLRCCDGPTWALRATAVGRDGAGRVDGVLECGDLALAGASLSRDAAAAFEYDKEVIDGAVVQRVGKLDFVADELVAFGRKDNDIALGVNLARLRFQITWSAAT